MPHCPFLFALAFVKPCSGYDHHHPAADHDHDYVITASHWAVVHREPGWGSSLPVEVLLGADQTHQKSLPTRILGPILVSYVYEERGTYWLFGLCAASLLATGILTLAAYR